MRNRATTAGVVLACVLLAVPARAEQTASPPTAEQASASAAASLKVQVTLSRYLGDKKIASLPYVLGVAAGSKTSLRMGLDVPVLRVTPEPNTPGQASYSYRDVGTNIDCYADLGTQGQYKLIITVSDSSAQLEAPKTSEQSVVIKDVPIFRTFNSSFTALLKDGQTTQYTSATDPVTGEVMKIDVTLNVMR